MECALAEREKNLRLMDAILATIVNTSLEYKRERHRVRCVSLVEIRAAIRAGKVDDG
jgi:hypothetical protein